MPKGNRWKKGHKSEPLDWRLGMTTQKSVWGDLTREQLVNLTRQAASHFIATGEELEGTRLTGRWRNPESRNPLHSDWKTTNDENQPLGEFFRTLPMARKRLQDYDGPTVQPLSATRKPPGKAKSSFPVHGPQTRRGAAASSYQSKVKAIREKHPKWDFKKAQAAYRKQAAAAKTRAKKAAVKAKAKRKKP